MPGHSEQYPPVVSLGNHYRIIALQERTVEHQVHPLAGTYQMFPGRNVHLHNVIYKNSGSIDYDFRFHSILFPGFQIFHHHPGNLFILFLQPGHLAIVHHITAVIGTRLCQIHRQTRIVELPVMIDYAAF